MRDDEKNILTHRLKYFVEDIFPVDLLPSLTCLTTSDREQIQRDQDRHGDRRATDTLVDRLKRRKDGFPQFVNSLRENGSEHVAMLLDPEMKVVNPESQNQANDQAAFDLISGAVVDMRFKGWLNDENGGSLGAAEDALANEYGQASSPQTIRLRNELSEFLPPGAVFYRTEKGSVICKFRVCRVSAARELWKMYQDEILHDKMLNLMLTDKLKAKMIEKSNEGTNKETRGTVKMGLYLMEEKFEDAVNNLQAIESTFNRDGSNSASRSQHALGGSEGNDAGEKESLSALVIPPVYLDNDQSAEAHHLTLREYQKELAAPALKGQNTIICAPANSGKTYVAIHITRSHLDKYTDDAGEEGIHNRKKPKVIFIVSTVSLGQQQKERFEYFLNDKYSVADIFGASSTDVPLEFLLENNDVIILTAQILVNALERKVKSTERSKVKLTDISMMIFDECHHTNKDHSYNNIMKKYMAMKMQPGMQETLPQVIGLTASLGVGKSKTLTKAKEHILTLSSNLDAELISTVKENVEELKKNVNLPDRRLHSVSKPKIRRFEQVIGKVMDVIEKKVGTVCGKPPQGKGDQEYRQWVETLYSHAVAEGNRFLVTFAEQLREYHIALTINDSTRMKDASRRLQDYFEKRLDERKFTETDRKLKDLYMQAKAALQKYVDENGQPLNPMLEKLKELIVSYHTPAEQACISNKDLSNEPGKDPRRTDQTSDLAAKDDAASVGTDRGGAADDDVGTLSNNGSQAAAEDSQDNTASNDEFKQETEVVVEENDPHDINTSSESRSKTELEDQHKSATSHNEGHVCNSSSNCDSPLEAAEQNKMKDQLIKDTTCNSEEDLEVTETGKDRDNEGNENNDSETEEMSNKDADPDKNPKGIIFTQTRESTKVLEEWVGEDEDLQNLGLSPFRLLGAGDGENGMTQNERESVIQKFRRGDVNLIIATTVAEEGLDIKECNYVIRYNMTGNEISSVQSRGRVRADMGEYNVLAGAKSGVLDRERMNQFKEILMTDALADIQNLKADDFKDKINNLQTRAVRKCQLRAGIKCQNLMFDPDDISFHCRKCNLFACQVHEIRRIQDSFHVITSLDFLDKATIKAHPKPKTIDGITKKDKLHCGECDEDWGITVLIDGIELPCIKVSSFVLRDKSGRGKMYKKWVQCPFEVEQVDIADIAAERIDGEEMNDGDDWAVDLN